MTFLMKQKTHLPQKCPILQTAPFCEQYSTTMKRYGGNSFYRLGGEAIYCSYTEASIYIERYSVSQSRCEVYSFVTTHRQTNFCLCSSHYVSLSVCRHTMLECLCVVTLCQSVSLSVCHHTVSEASKPLQGLEF